MSQQPFGPVSVFVSADFANYEMMRFTLREIAKRHRDDPYGFTGEEAAQMARTVLTHVDEAEQREGHDRAGA